MDPKTQQRFEALAERYANLDRERIARQQVIKTLFPAPVEAFLSEVAGVLRSGGVDAVCGKSPKRVLVLTIRTSSDADRPATLEVGPDSDGFMVVRGVGHGGQEVCSRRVDPRDWVRDMVVELVEDFLGKALATTSATSAK